MSDTDLRKSAPHLLDRVDSMLATYERRQTTNVPGTISLIRDLAATLRAEMKGWANARGDAVDYSLRAGELEAIVRDLAASNPVGEVHVDWDETVAECTQCGSRMPGEDEGIEHLDDCAFARSRAWVSAHPVPGDPQ